MDTVASGGSGGGGGEQWRSGRWDGPRGSRGAVLSHRKDLYSRLEKVNSRTNPSTDTHIKNKLTELSGN